jgi:hypothetical protein
MYPNRVLDRELQKERAHRANQSRAAFARATARGHARVLKVLRATFLWLLLG